MTSLAATAEGSFGLADPSRRVGRKRGEHRGHAGRERPGALDPVNSEPALVRRRPPGQARTETALGPRRGCSRRAQRCLAPGLFARGAEGGETSRPVPCAVGPTDPVPRRGS